MESQRVRIIITVAAGLVPNMALPEYTKQFVVGSDEWYVQGAYEGKKEEASMKVMQTYGLAMEYHRSLMNPKALNWVRMDWIYL